MLAGWFFYPHQKRARAGDYMKSLCCRLWDLMAPLYFSFRKGDKHRGGITVLFDFFRLLEFVRLIYWHALMQWSPNIFDCTHLSLKKLRN